MFNFIKKYFKLKNTSPSKYVVVNRKEILNISGEVYKIILKDPPRGISRESSYITFWDRVDEFSDIKYIDLDTGEDCITNTEEYHTKESITCKTNPIQNLQDKMYITDDLGLIIPAESIYLIEPCSETLTDSVEVTNTILIKRDDMKDGDTIVLGKFFELKKIIYNTSQENV